MIQRIQTIYLLLVVALGITLMAVPVVKLVTPEGVVPQRVWELSATGIDEVTENVTLEHPLHMKGIWGLLLATMLVPALALVDIVLYKKRILQARINIFTAFFCLGYYAVLFTLMWFIKQNLHVEWHIMFWVCLPLIQLVLTIMATRRILKDEALVRAADRIR